MIAYLEIKRGTITIDITLVKGECPTEAPWAINVISLKQGIERMMLHSQREDISAPAFTVRAFDDIRQTVCNFAIDTQVPGLDTIISIGCFTILIIYR